MIAISTQGVDTITSFGYNETTNRNVGFNEAREDLSSECAPPISPEQAIATILGPDAPTPSPLLSEIVNASDAEGASGSGQKQQGSAIKKKRPVLRSYVPSPDSEPKTVNEREDDFQRSPVDVAGIAHVMDHERKCKRIPKEMPHKNPGYDIESRDADGNIVRYIEGKSMSGLWTSGYVVLSKPQFDAASQFGERFWLYVVDRAQDDDCKIHRIQNPAQRANHYMFDDGWRLLGIENCKPFEILNLGKYERQYWQGITFREKSKHITEQALYEYLAFILKLYGAQPIAGMAHLHGKKGRAMIHIGAVDAPVTISEIDLAVEECVQIKQPELHVLGWEWEMGLYDLMVEAAKKKGLKLLLLQIPREVMEQQAAAKGDVHFFELAYLEAEVGKPASRSSLAGKKSDLAVQVTLKDFVIPNTELIPEEVRSKVKKWSDYIDYWAIDWDFQNDTFMQGWVAFRTRKERKLALTSDPHTYDKPGKYRILVKVIDIFGNDTSQAFDAEVR